jgi:hypothetical protein
LLSILRIIENSNKTNVLQTTRGQENGDRRKFSREHHYPDYESVFTRIIWKNKFVDDIILDRYESDFDVLYE